MLEAITGIVFAMIVFLLTEKNKKQTSNSKKIKKSC
jgi:hypothetical protein